MTTLNERFWAKVSRRGTSCWIWTASTVKGGYGKFWDGARLVLAHRFSYELAIGPIPEDMTVDHRCFTPACVNPTHLRLLTNRQNAQNQLATLATHCVNGHPYDAENTYLRPERYRGGRRDCRACGRERVRNYRERASA